MPQSSPLKGKSHKLTEHIRNQQDHVQDDVHITLLLHQHGQQDQTQAAPKRKQQSLGLKQNVRLCSKPKKAKANLADIQAELELETAKLINEAQQKLELSKIDEEIAKAKAVETLKAVIPLSRNYSMSST